MINISNKQRKYIWKPEIPENWHNLIYNVYESVNGKMIFTGKTNVTDGFEIDSTDWVEQYWDKQSGEGAFPFGSDMYITVEPDTSGSLSALGKFVSYDKNKSDLVSFENKDGVVSLTVNKFNHQTNRRGIYIYPVYYFNIISSVDYPAIVGKEYCFDSSFISVPYTTGEYTSNCNIFYDDHSPYQPAIPGDGEFENQVKDVLSGYTSGKVTDYDFINWNPKMMPTGSGSVIYLPGSVTSTPIYVENDIHSKISRFPIRMTTKTLDEIFEGFYDFICDNISGDIELTGYGYNVIYLYDKEGTFPSPESDYNFSSTIYSELNENTCPNMSIVFCNSDFKGKNAGGDDVYDIRVPLQVQNGILRGKTTNKISKTTWMNRYNDIHNSTADNSIELECYVDYDYMKMMTGDDVKYTQLMMVAQTARTTYLTGTARISGIDMEEELTCLNCRVKDVEKVETYSKYNQSHPIPSLKIIIEIYR